MNRISTFNVAGCLTMSWLFVGSSSSSSPSMKRRRMEEQRESPRLDQLKTEPRLCNGGQQLVLCPSICSAVVTARVVLNLVEHRSASLRMVIFELQ